MSFFGRMNASEFLASMTDDGRAEVSAKELRNLLQDKRKLECDLKELQYKFELLQLRNVSLKQDIVEIQTNKLEVYGIDLTA